MILAQHDYVSRLDLLADATIYAASIAQRDSMASMAADHHYQQCLLLLLAADNFKRECHQYLSRRRNGFDNTD